MSIRQFTNIKLPKIPRNRLNMSHSRLLSADPFYIYPIFVEDCIPGDFWTLRNEILIRNNPLASPIMHEQNAYIHYYFVPYRILWKQWEKFFSGGVDGKFTANIPTVQDVVSTYPNEIFQIGGLFEYIYNQACTTNLNDLVKQPNAFPLQAYYMIWNEYYRDQNLMVDLKEASGTEEWDWLHNMDLNYFVNEGYTNNFGFLKRCWQKDYFTSSLPWQQRGVVPSFSIFNTGSVAVQALNTPPVNYAILQNTANNNSNAQLFTTVRDGIDPNAVIRATQFWSEYANGLQLNADVHDMRFAFQVTKYLERSARCGHRYIEQLKAHYRAFPRDERLQRPEYIGGMKLPIIVNEVLQTAEEQTAGSSGVGSMYGHGISADRELIGRYRVQEHGVIMGLLSIMPTTMYMQGIERMWLKESKYDFYFPVFAHLSEQAVYVEEIYNHQPAVLDRVLGYNARYDEYRFRRNTVHGLFKSDFAYWHMGRKFDNAPTLNKDLVMPNEDEIHDVVNGIKRVLQVPSEPMYLVHIGNISDAVRPMPYMAEPGLVDHG